MAHARLSSPAQFGFLTDDWAKRSVPTNFQLLSKMVGTAQARLCPPYGITMNTDEFLTAALQNPVNEIIAEELFRLALPDAWLVSGCLVQTVWNVLTKRAVDYGINDYDVFYFDPDPSWEAEDKIIRTLAERLGSRGIQVEARNQARVHLWYPEKHGLPYPELRCSTQGIDRFLTRNTQIGIRRMRELTRSTHRMATTMSPP